MYCAQNFWWKMKKLQFWVRSESVGWYVFIGINILGNIICYYLQITRQPSEFCVLLRVWKALFCTKSFFFIRIKVINFGLVFCSEWHSDTLILETHYRQKWHEGGGLNVSHCKEKIINNISDLPLGLLEGVGLERLLKSRIYYGGGKWVNDNIYDKQYYRFPSLVLIRLKPHYSH